MGKRHDTAGSSSRLLQPISVIDTSAEEPNRTVERLRDVYAASTFFAADFPKGDFQSRIENWSLPGLAVTRQVSDANKIFIAGGKGFSVPDLIYVRINFSGSNRGVFGDRSYLARAGDISIIRSTDIGLTDFTQRHTMVVYLPRSDALENPNVSLPDVIRGESPSGRLLGSVFRELKRALPETEAAQATDMAARLKRVIRAMLETPHPDLDREDLAQARYLAVIDYINENVDRPDLDAVTICRYFGISRPTLYRMFRDINGVQSFILERRLCRVFEDLAVSRRQRGAIAQIAERWGFNDASKFSNQFRRLFGMTPSDVLGTHHRTETTARFEHEPVRQSPLDRLLNGLSG